MDELEERFANSLHGTARSWRQAVDRRLKSLGMSQASWMTITVAASARPALSQTELADRLAVEGATMVAMIDRLVKAGLVSRELSTEDRRVKRVIVTADGHALYDKVKTEAAALRRDLLARIPRGDLATATRVLEDVQSLIDAAS